MEGARGLESLAKEERLQGRRGSCLSDSRRDRRLQACRSRQDKVPRAAAALGLIQHVSVYPAGAPGGARRSNPP